MSSIFAKSPHGKSKKVSWLRYICPAYLILFQALFIVFIGIFGNYKFIPGQEEVPFYYAMWIDVHTMMFVGFGFLMVFLKRHGYGSVGINFLIAAFVFEWSIIVHGWFHHGIGHTGKFDLSIPDLLSSDFIAAAILISFGAVIGKVSPIQMVILATIEVVLQVLNEYIGLDILEAYDIGESFYVHAFGAYFGLAVSKIINHKKVESPNEEEAYNSDLFAMIGTLFLWIYWPSFNSALAVDEGQIRAIVNTVLSIAASCVVTFAISTIVGKGKLNMVHVQNATLAGGVAVGTVADMNIRPYAAMIIGSLAGILSTLGFQYLTPLLKRLRLHDTCGVHNLHGMPGLLSGLAGVIVARVATRDNYFGDNLYKFYPSRIPKLNSPDYFKYNLDQSPLYKDGGKGRTSAQQAGFQLAGIAVTLGIAIVGGLITGIILRLPFIEKIKREEDLFNDEPFWRVPEDFHTGEAQQSQPILNQNTYLNTVPGIVGSTPPYGQQVGFQGRYLRPAFNWW